VTAAVTTEQTWISHLRDELAGTVIVPGDPDYDAARRVFVGHVERHPSAIARVANATDVAAVIRVARENNLPLGVKSGGHDGAGLGVSDGGVVVDLHDMKAIEIDPVTKTAWAETGLTASEVLEALAPHGFVIGFGDTGTVGIGGITLGGGVGFLVRKHGLTIDSLLAAEIVTADGDILPVDASTHPDLFWAIRGGGGNFGVATRFLYRLHPAETFVGGIMVLSGRPEIVARFVAAAEAAPREVSTIANVMNCPPMPFVPEEWHGKTVILAMLGYTGDAENSESEMAPFRALDPIADLTKPMPYTELFAPEDPDYRPKAVQHIMFMDHVDEPVAREIVDAVERSDAALRAVQIRVLGGAMADVAPDATAFAHRQAKVMAIVVNFFEGDIGGPDHAKRARWVHDVVARIDDGTPGAYVNFLADEGPARISDAYPRHTLRRLAEIKKRYDPDNVFRLNQNIAPAA
jgi:FAD/FMN-containing dehydrogenase